MSFLAADHADYLPTTFQISAVHDFFDLLHTPRQEAARAPVFPPTIFAVLLFGFSTFAYDVPKFKAFEAYHFLRASLKGVPQRKAIHAEKLFGAVSAGVPNTLTSKALDCTVEIARSLLVARLVFVVGFLKLVHLLQEVAGLASFAIAAACYLVKVGHGWMLFMLDGSVGVLYVERQPGRNLLQELLNN